MWGIGTKFNVREVFQFVGRSAMLPSVGVGVAQLEASFYLLQPDAARIFIIAFLGEVAVAAKEGDEAVVVVQRDVYVAFFCRADTVFEGVFHQGNKDVWCNAQSLKVVGVEICHHFHLPADPQLHQGNVVVEKLSLFLQTHPRP